MEWPMRDWCLLEMLSTLAFDRSDGDNIAKHIVVSESLTHVLENIIKLNLAILVDWKGIDVNREESCHERQGQLRAS